MFRPFALALHTFRALTLLGVVAVGSLWAAGQATGQAAAQGLNAPLMEVVYQNGDTLRALCGRELDDPDLWPLVLRLSGVAAITDLQPGVVLKLPVAQVRATDAALGQALNAIQTANAEGARLFAPDTIVAAINSHADAVLRRGEGAWAVAVQLALTATGFANEALQISLDQRDRAAEALVTDVQGNVEGRRPDASRWTGRALDDALVQFERLRTLSGSTTQVTFRDLSRLRLNPNSNATIQRMRSDPLTGGEVTKIELVSGDFYALLNQLGEGTSFEIDVAGLETTTDSADFWIKTDESGARFANYDEAALVVGSGAQTVSLGEGEGAVVDAAGDAQVTEVLDRPVLLTPLDRSPVYGRTAALTWAPKAAAAGYWLEVAADAGFNDMRLSEWGILVTGFEVAGIGPGPYHWRVSALDAFGLPGSWSLAQGFDLISDTTPPYLALAEPAEGALIDTPDVVVLGETEPGVSLTVQGLVAPLSVAGAFRADLVVEPGQTAIALMATDPAGNVTQKVVTVVYRPAEALAILPDAELPRDAAGRFLTATDQLAFRAASGALAGAAVRLVGPDGAVAVQASVAEGGAISLTIPASAEARVYRLEVLSPLGAAEATLDLAVVSDTAPPEIGFSSPPPQATATPRLSLQATAGDAVRVTVNGAEVALMDGAFRLEADLAPGLNAFEIVATDLVGNVGLRTATVILDAEPPVIRSARLTRPEGPQGTVQIDAEAGDTTGLRAAGRFVIAVGGVEQSGVLRCEGQTGVCRATLPPVAGEVRLIAVSVTDYAGNGTERRGN